MPSKADILLVEDTASLSLVYSGWLEKAGLTAELATNGGDALAKLRSGSYGVTLLDLQLPDLSGFDILKALKEEAIPTTVVVITANGSINTAVEAMRSGAYDFLVKPLAEDRLITTTKNAAERQELERVVEDVRSSTTAIKQHGFIGSSPAMLGVYKTIESVAASSVPVFVTGESGTGKEVCAAAIHATGPRQNKPFIALNCAAIPKDLLESEIFGHVVGAFTGATKARSGAAKSADGGTLFLDEICELDLSLQAKLLRFLQTGSIQPVGSDQVTPVDVRIVCATNRDPRLEVAEGRFREDLYYRLHVVPVKLPALRDRGADAVEIASAFLARYAAEDAKSFAGFSPEAEAVLLSYDWPGNVRELQNVVRSAVVLHDGEVVTPEMLAIGETASSAPKSVSMTPARQGSPEAPAPCQQDTAAETVTLSLNESFAENERALIEAVIAMCDGSIPKAARVLGLSPSTIYRKREGWSA